jgi:hypothetical protein
VAPPDPALWQQLILDLDRCQHGRHSADPCFGCPDGQSTGNLLIPPGTLIGTGLHGWIVVPPNEQRYEPAAWRVPDGEVWEGMARSAAHSQSLMRIGTAAYLYHTSELGLDRIAALETLQLVLAQHAEAFPAQS